MFGCLNLKTKHFYWKSTKKSNSKVFCEFLSQIRTKFPGKQIVIILDNASIHKSKETKAYLTRWSQIHLFYLPPYSPEYNPVEIVWRWAKTKVHGFSFRKSIAVIIERFTEIFWKYNNNAMFNPLKLQLNAYADIL